VPREYKDLSKEQHIQNVLFKKNSISETLWYAGEWTRKKMLSNLVHVFPVSILVKMRKRNKKAILTFV
jgi:hypothetical protein